LGDAGRSNIYKKSSLFQNAEPAAPSGKADQLNVIVKESVASKHDW